MDNNEQLFWNEAYGDLKLFIAPEHDLVRRWIELYIPRGAGVCIELGCFPGRYLHILGQLGYELNGIDFADRTEKDLPIWLKSEGLKVGSFLRGDIFTVVPTLKQRFDIVCSFGLIEHFAGFREAILLHARLVRNGGYLIISVPNFAGMIQRILHLLLDRRNLELHNLAAMNPELWKGILLAENFELVFSGHFGGFDFWVDNHSLNYPQKLCLALINMLKGPGRHVFSSSLYSPYAGIVARKRC
jgi:L-malate glycosyltransferase